jgi:hypothetical protein
MFTEPDKVIKSPKQEHEEIVRGRRSNQRNLHKRPTKLIARALPYNHTLKGEQFDAFWQCIRTVELELSGGRQKSPRPNEERAIAAIKRFMVAVSTKDEIDPQTPVSLLFEARIANCLQFNGVRTISALLCESRNSLTDMPNVGPATVKAICSELRRYGFYLKRGKAKKRQCFPS